jgi:hypothetical protein
MQPLDLAIQKVWRIKLSIWAGLLGLGAVSWEVWHLFDVARWWPAGTLAGTVVLVGTLLLVYLPRRRYRSWRYTLGAEELYLERGVLNRVRTIVPLRRVQHLDVSQDLVEREFDLGKLIVHTAGTRSSEVVLPGLRLAEAERLRDEIRRYVLAETP